MRLHQAGDQNESGCRRRRTDAHSAALRTGSVPYVNLSPERQRSAIERVVARIDVGMLDIVLDAKLDRVAEEFLYQVLRFDRHDLLGDAPRHVAG